MAYAHLRTNETVAIARRRADEDNRLAMTTAVSANQQLFQLAHWERATDKQVTHNQIKLTAKKLQKQDEDRLRVRRSRLAELLSGEDEEWRNELAMTMETSTERAKRLVVHARQLKQEREEKRKAFAEQMYERQWKMSCDDLRTIDSEYFKLHCNDEVIKQIQEKQRRSISLSEEEAAWSAQWERERLQRVTADTAAQQQRTVAMTSNRLALKQQVEDQLSTKQAEAMRVQKEKEDLNERLKHETALLRAKAAAELERKRQLQRDIVTYNATIEKQRGEQRTAQRLAERASVEEKMEEFHQHTVAKQEQQSAARRDMEEYRQYLAAKKEEEKKMEQMMEAMIANEVTRENDRRDEQWRREQVARDKLMKQVLETREIQLLEKERAKLRAEEERLLEKRAHEFELQRVADDEEAAKLAERAEKLARKKELEAQMDANGMRRHLEEQRAAREKQAALQQEAEYRTMLAQAKRQSVDAAKLNYGITHMRK